MRSSKVSRSANGAANRNVKSRLVNWYGFLSHGGLTLSLGALALSLFVTGCTRQHWREQADTKTYTAMADKFSDPRWELPRVDLTPDPNSRFYDPYDPDKPPLPPDDPKSHEYMHWVYGMRGSKHWHDNGDIPTVENPAWLEPYGGDESVVTCNYSTGGTLPEIKNLTLEESLGLSYRHSREFQTDLENLYLTSLALTFERFRFDVQFFGISNRAPSSDLNFDAAPGRFSNLTSTNRAGINKFFPTGGQFAAELANNTLWLFSGPNNSNTQSLLSYSLVQPLLRNGGRKFALENLTQAERSVLYAIRDFSRYRMGFFTNIVAGTRSSAGVSGVGGQFAGNGYLSLLGQLQTIENLKFNIRLQEQQLAQLRAQASQEARNEVSFTSVPGPNDTFALPPGFTFPPSVQGQFAFDQEAGLLRLRGDLTEAQLREIEAATDNVEFTQAVRRLAQRAGLEVVTINVAQIETQLANSRIQLANQQIQLQSSIDTFKFALGLPTDTLITIDKSMLKPFELIDPRLVALQDAFRFYIRDVSAINEDDPSNAELLKVAEKLDALRLQLRRDGLDVIQNDFDTVRKQLKSNGKESSTAVDTDVTDPAAYVYDPELDQFIFNEILERLAAAEVRLQTLLKLLQDGKQDLEARKALRTDLTKLQEAFYKETQGLARVQVDLRVEVIPLNPYSLPLQDAVNTALENRVDLMNQRSVVVDARRRMEIAANQLQATMNVVAQGSIGTRTLGQLNDNPLDFRAMNSDYQVGLQFTTPIQLVRERNVYRAAIIDYQRSRRNYMRQEDQVKLDIRNAWRQLTVLKRNFAVAKQQTRIAALQYDQTAEQTNAPLRQGANNNSGQQGLQLLQGFSAILSAQNNLIQIWVNFETNRLNIHRDMGIMQIDERGVWTDNYYQDRLIQAGGVMLPELRLVDPPTLIPASAASGLSLFESYEGAGTDVPGPDDPATMPGPPAQELNENGLRQPADELPPPNVDRAVQPASAVRYSGGRRVQTADWPSSHAARPATAKRVQPKPVTPRR